MELQKRRIVMVEIIIVIVFLGFIWYLARTAKWMWNVTFSKNKNKNKNNVKKARSSYQHKKKEVVKKDVPISKEEVDKDKRMSDIDLFMTRINRSNAEGSIYFSKLLDFDHSKYSKFVMDEKKLENAHEKYAKYKGIEKPLILFDNTLFGSAEEGFLLTTGRLYSDKSKRPLHIDSVSIKEEENTVSLEILDDLTKKQFINLIPKIAKYSIDNFPRVTLEEEERQHKKYIESVYAEGRKNSSKSRTKPSFNNSTKTQNNDLHNLALAITNNQKEEWDRYITKIQNDDLKYLALAITNNQKEEWDRYITKIQNDDLKYLALAITNNQKEEWDRYITKIQNDDLKYLALAITNNQKEEWDRYITKLKN